MMKCPICGKTTLPGAKLCGPCRAALKRAKDDSVWELPPSQRQGEPQAASSRPARWVLGSPRFNGWRMWTLAGGALAVCVLAGLHFARSDEPAAAPLAPPAMAARPIGEEPPPAALQRAVPTAAQPVATAAPTSALGHADDGLVQPPRSDHSGLRSTKIVRPPAEPVVQPPPPAAEPPPAVEPPRVVAAPPPPPPARPVDPMQRLQDALGRCRGEDLFSRLGCEYRARTTYCEGHWGESPQCPAPTGNDHGQ